MPNNPDTNAAEGFGLAGFLIARHTLGAQCQRREITGAEAASIIARSRHFLPQFPGDPKIAEFADRALGLAEQMLSTASARKPTEGLN
jgi:hypothetical protein